MNGHCSNKTGAFMREILEGAIELTIDDILRLIPLMVLLVNLKLTLAEEGV